MYLLGLVVLLTGCEPREAGPRVLRISGQTMGTQYTMTVVDPPETLTEQQLKRPIDRRLQQLELRFSTYDPSSDLSLVNEEPTIQWIDVPPELAAVLGEAMLAARHTEGAYDPTVGPLVNLWDFGPGAKSPPEPPTDEQIAETLKNVGLKCVDVQFDPPAVRKSAPEVYIDLSGIVKGYAADELSRLLVELGLGNHMVNIGGEVKTSGTNPRGTPWQIAIERPEPGPRRPYRTIELSGMALATSGNYRNYFEMSGRRVSHIIDPRTGRPVEHQVVSASVIHHSCMRADALATALMVLGPKDAMEMAADQELAVMLVLEEEGKYRDLITPEFQQYLPGKEKSEQ